jgi:uncharacterized Fe-S cluster-containing MiaB family protein
MSRRDIWGLSQIINEEYRAKVGRGLLERAFTVSFVFDVFKNAVEYIVLNKLDAIENYDTTLSNALKYFIDNKKYMLYPKFPDSKSAIEAFHETIEIMKRPSGFFASYESRYRAFIDSLKAKLLQP